MWILNCICLNSRTNIMEKLCVRCFKRFNKTQNRQPKILPCGHKCCFECIEMITESNWHCPPCGKPVYIANKEKLPTDQHLMNVCANLLNPELNSTYFIHCMDIISNELNRVNSRLWDVALITSQFEMKPNDKSFERDWKKPKRIFEFIEPKLSILQNKLLPQSPDAHFLVDRKFSAMNIKQTIVKKLSHGQTLYCANYIDGELKYGKVGLIGNGITVNSLSLTERKSNSMAFLLKEFKNTFNEQLCAFFTFPCNEELADGATYSLIFDIVSSHRKSGFLELCTGELRSIFKDSEYILTEDDCLIIKLNSNHENDLKIHSGNKMVELNDDDIVLRYFTSDQGAIFEIRKVKGSNTSYRAPLTNIIGKLMNKINFKFLYPSNPDKRRILECGVGVFKFPVNNIKIVEE